MKHYLKFSIAYFGLAAIIVLITRESGLMTLHNAWISTVSLAPLIGQNAASLALVGVLLTSLTRIRSIQSVLASVLTAFVATLFFQSGFTLIKTSLPYIVPFYADIAFAEWDRLLHGGQDPWIITHAVAEYLPMEFFVPFYLSVWVWPAIFLPVILAATDNDRRRVARTMVLWGMAWILIGNVMAIAGMSGGPVYYDRLYGGDRFAELTAAIKATPAISGHIGLVQENLWTAYTSREQSIGSGISAFPSVHLSISVVAALYMWERARLLGLAGAIFVLVIMFLSVYSGYHYAIDGYVSILVMWSIWAFMRSWDGSRTANRAVPTRPNGQFLHESTY